MKLSVIILTKNEEKMIEGCLDSANQLADEIIIVDDQSTDKTREIAQKYTQKIFIHPRQDFASQREFALQQATGKWVFYLDADERLTEELIEEIKDIINHQSSIINHCVAFFIPRKNIFLGREQQPDKVERLFKKETLLGWQGKIHESPKIKGPKGDLKNYLIHLTHRDISSMIEKTLEWSEIEAELRYQAGHPKMVWWRFLRIIGAEFYHQFFQNKAYRYGTEGWIEGFFQVFSLFVTYVRLWEKQRKESLEKTYEKIDRKILGKSA